MIVVSLRCVCRRRPIWRLVMIITLRLVCLNWRGLMVLIILLLYRIRLIILIRIACLRLIRLTCTLCCLLCTIRVTSCVCRRRLLNIVCLEMRMKCMFAARNRRMIMLFAIGPMMVLMATRLICWLRGRRLLSIGLLSTLLMIYCRRWSLVLVLLLMYWREVMYGKMHPALIR